MRSLLLVVLVGCTPDASTSAPTPLSFAAYSPAQATSHDLFMAGRGQIVVMANRFSRDGGATWLPNPAQLGALSRVAIDGTTVTTYASGLVRWDVTSGTIAAVAGAPSFTADRTWRTDPATGRAIAFDPIHNGIAIEGAAGWTTATLPQPTATELDPFVNDIESNGAVMMSVSAWGVHRSSDGGATWQLAATPSDAGRDLLVLADNRFLLFGGATSYVFDATGAAGGTEPGVIADIGDASACDDGAIVVHDKRSSDLGATWQPLIASGDLAMAVERIGCGGGRYWMLANSTAWGYRLVSFTSGQPAIAAGNWEGPTAWSLGGPQLTRAPDGTFLVAGLAWRDGDAAWTLREIPARTWAATSVALGIANGVLYASHDTAASWTAQPTPPFATADGFGRTADGTLLVSTFTGATDASGDAWQSEIWRSSDAATWTAAYDGSSTRAPNAQAMGDAHRFVGVAADGAWIATDAISRDAGATWTATTVHNDHGPAFLDGERLVVTQADQLWHVYADAGSGALAATYKLDVAGAPVSADAIESVAFDDAGYAYIAGGAPYVQLWRSTSPL